MTADGFPPSFVRHRPTGERFARRPLLLELQAIKRGITAALT
jgi:hypothetical protein